MSQRRIPGKRRGALPPAGDAQRDELKARGDALAEQAETLGVVGGAINPKAFAIDREIAGHVNELDVSNASPEYAYAWVWTGQQGIKVKEKLARRVREGDGLVVCWEVVNGDMPEASELKTVDGTRRLGDVMLLRCRKERKEQLDAQDEIQRARREASINEPLEELARKYPRLVKVHTDLNDPTLQAGLRRGAARGFAAQQFDTAIRGGTVPGMPAGR